MNLKRPLGALCMDCEGLGECVTAEELEDELEAYVPGIESPLNEEEFQYYHGEDVLSLYHWLKDACARQGWFLFSSLSYKDMLELAYRTSPKEKPVC